MKRIFNVAGPCLPQQHYMLDASRRLGSEIRTLIGNNQYFVVHAARQTGKTTLLLDLTEKINREGNYYALRCSLEKAYAIVETKEGIRAVVGCLRHVLQYSKIPGGDCFGQNLDYDDYANVLSAELTKFCASLDKPLVIFFDEADCLSEGTLISFMRQLRDGYSSRPSIPFVCSLALVGMRNIRDFKARVRPDSETLGSASPFNIVTEALTLRSFSADEVAELYAQHTADTGQNFEQDAIALVWQQTQGQPWLVNAIAREAVEKILENDCSQPVTAAHVEQAIQNIILRRDTHIDSLLERLKEPRVQRIIEPVILGEDTLDRTSDDFYYTRDLGLIRATDDKRIVPGNPIYAEIIVRTLSFNSQETLKADSYPYQMPRYLKNGRIDMGYLMRDFQAFWRENAEIWVERFDYKEAAPHLVMMAFLQRVINGGGRINREMATGTGRIDLCVEYEGRRYPIELKLWRGDKTYTKGVEQLSHYMDTLGCTAGWLLVFDRRNEVDWENKIFTREENATGKKITIVGC